ncbi:MAG: hypothetical protein ACM3P1_02995 [Candidatus Saccharibacteria bacterium]
MKKLTIIFLLALFSMGVHAQERRGGNPEMFEKIKAEKISFFTSKLSLTPAEAQAFWPVYNEYEKKRFDIQREVHRFERMPEDDFAKLSDSEIEKMTNDYINSFEKEAQLLKDYNKQFLKILPRKKVLMVYKAENEFRSHLIREFRKGDGPRRD